MELDAQGQRPGSAPVELDALRRENALLQSQLAAALEREQRLLSILETRLLPAPAPSLVDRVMGIWQQVRG